MFKLLASLSVGLGLIACSTQNKEAAHQLASNVHALEQNKVISVIADKNLAVAQGAQNIVEFAKFHALDNVYDSSGTKLLIPRNAVITGIYTNDGLNCVIEWKAVYADEAAYSRNYGALALEQEAVPSRCEPLHGVKEGERATITFMGGAYQE